MYDLCVCVCVCVVWGRHNVAGNTGIAPLLTVQRAEVTLPE